MAEFEIGGRKYQSGKMPARTQFHVMRRMAPILPAMQASITVGIKIKAAQDAGAPITDAMKEEAAVSGLEFIGAIGTLSDEAANYILDNCLSVVEVQQTEFSGKWSKLRGAGGLMFSLDMMTELEIVKEVVQDNYGPFFQGVLARLSA
jgi:hypothetical protein